MYDYSNTSTVKRVLPYQRSIRNQKESLKATANCKGFCY